MNHNTFESEYTHSAAFPRRQSAGELEAAMLEMATRIHRHARLRHVLQRDIPHPMRVRGRLFSVYADLVTTNGVQSRSLVVTLIDNEDCDEVVSVDLCSEEGQMLARKLASARPDAKTEISFWPVTRKNADVSHSDDVEYMPTVEQYGLLLSAIDDHEIREQIATTRAHLIATGRGDPSSLVAKERSAKVSWHVDLVRRIMASMSTYRCILNNQIYPEPPTDDALYGCDTNSCGSRFEDSPPILAIIPVPDHSANRALPLSDLMFTPLEEASSGDCVSDNPFGI